MIEAFGVQPNRKPWSEAVATFISCLALGPPIGGAVFALLLPLTPARSGVPYTDVVSLAGHLLMGLSMGLFAFPFSYFMGGIQAAATGFTFVAYGWFRGRPPFWFVALTAAVVYAGAVFMDIAGYYSRTLVPMLLVHAVTTFLCWLLIRDFWREKMP